METVREEGAAGRGVTLAGPLRRLLVYVAVYYGLWAASDELILYGGLDAGWGLRVLPNQLYYSFWIPVVTATLSRQSN